METGNPWGLLIYVGMIMLLIGLNGFFVAAEIALAKASRSRIERESVPGSRSARLAQAIACDPDAYLAACQLGITLTSLGLGWIGEPAVSVLLSPLVRPIGLPEPAIQIASMLIGFTAISAFHITLGEQFPKAWAVRKSEKITIWFALPLTAFYRLARPFIRLLNAFSRLLLRLSGVESSAERPVHTEEEIRGLMKESSKRGLLDSTEFAMVDNIFDFAETTAREIMIPRTEMVCLFAARSYEENRRTAIIEMHTRYPVCDPDKDHIVGFVHIKDLLKLGDGAGRMDTIIRPMTKVPESMQISVLLKLMQRQKSQMALLIDEYGGTSGLVTFEDIIEEIVGEIQDEFDEERPQIEHLDEWTYSIDGRLLIEEVNGYFGLAIESDDYDTIGGWIYSQVEMPPKPMQQVEWNGECGFVIEEIEHLRISRLLVHRYPGLRGGQLGEKGG